MVFTEGSAEGAGPLCTLPSVMENVLPWQGQTITPPCTPDTVQPWWVQIAENALNSPAVGWVTTTVGLSSTTPPPTGTLLSGTGVPAGLDAAELDAAVGPAGAADDDEGAALVVEADGVDVPADGEEHAAVTAAAATTVPPASSTWRRGRGRAGSVGVMRPPGSGFTSAHPDLARRRRHHGTRPPHRPLSGDSGRVGGGEPGGHALRLVTMGTDDRAEARLRQVYAEHGAVLLAFATRLCGGDRQRAEDVVQEVLVRAWRHPEVAASGPVAERSWLMTVTRNVAIDHIRMRKARPAEVGGAALELVGVSTASEDEIDRAVEAWTVAAALDELPQHQRDVIVETYFRGRSVAETAAVLGIPAGTVKSRAFHALRALRTLLAEGGVRA